MKKETEEVRYHVRYMPQGFDEWWDWKAKNTIDEAIESFQEYSPRVDGARKAHVIITTVTTTEETVMYL